MKLGTGLINFFFFLSCCSFAQGFKTRYTLPFGTNSSTKAIFETSQGQYLGFGYCEDTLNGKYLGKIVAIGINASGNVIWTKKYGGQSLLYLNNTFIARSFTRVGNNFFYTGCLRDTANKQIGVLIKFNSNGDTVWQKIYRDPADDIIPQMLTGSIDGGFLITGFFQGNGSPCMLIKTDANGNELWRKKITKVNPNVSDGKAIVQDSASKKIVIVGYQYLVSNDLHDNILVLDSLGNKLNQTHYTNVGGQLYDLIQTQDKNFVAVGFQYFLKKINGSNQLLARSFALKFNVDSINKPIWKYNGFDTLEFYNSFFCLKEKSNGDIVIGGCLDTLENRNMNRNIFARVTTFTKNGNLKSNLYYDYKTNGEGADNNQAMESIELTSDGGLVSAIAIANSPNPNPMFFVKYDASSCDSSAAHCATVNMVGVGELNHDSHRDENEELKISMKENEVFIQNNSGKIYNVKVFNLYGDLFFEKKDNYYNMNVSLANFEYGIYLILVENCIAVLRKKVLNLK